MSVLSSYRWHWSAGFEIGRDQYRLESQRGEFAISIWNGNEEYLMDAPLFWAHPADSRTRLSDAAQRFRYGIGIKRMHGRWVRGSTSVGWVFPWYHALLGLLSATGTWLLLAMVWRKLRRSPRTTSRTGS